MFWACVMASVAILSRSAAEQTIFGTTELEHDWAEAFKLIIRVQMQYPVPNGWRMALIFPQPIRRVEVWRAKVIDISADNKTHALKNAFFNAHLAKGENLKMAVTAYKVKRGEQPGNVTVLFRGGNVIPSLPTSSPQPTTPPKQQTQIHQLKPIDESDSGFKMIIEFKVPAAVNNWSISLKFTKNISTINFSIDKAKVTFQKKSTTDTMCLEPWPYNRILKAKSVLRLEFNCYKAKLYEAAPNAYFVFHPNCSKCKDFEFPIPIPIPVPGPAVPQESAVAELIHQWPPNNFKMRFELQVINSVRGGWKIALKFSKPVAGISNFNAAKLAGKSDDLFTYNIENFSGQIQYTNLKQCEKIKIELSGNLASGADGLKNPLTARAFFERKEPEYAEINPLGTCPAVPPSKATQ